MNPTPANPAAPGSDTLPDTAQWLTQQHIRDVACVFPDLAGFARGKLMPAAAFGRGAELRICQAIPMQAITGAYACDPIFPDADPDVRLLPDLSTLRRMPWSASPRAIAIHDAHELDGSPCPLAPRSVLQRVLAAYAALGLTPIVAPEIEFYLIAPHTPGQAGLNLPALRHGRQEAGQSAFGLDLLDEAGPFWEELHQALHTLGVATDTWLHEVGVSQFEVNLLHGPALAVADQAFYFKLAAREVALRHGLQAVFMAKPFADQAGSSMHLHISVVDAAGHNLFSAADGSATPAFGSFLAGLQTVGPDFMALWAPHVNSYRRYVAGSQAPTSLHWGYDNRTTGLRVPHSPPAARRVENRVAGADANPYLAMAASLAAGLAGLQQRLEPTQPLAGNGYQQPHTLPLRLDAALQKMEQSVAVLSGLGADFVQGFCAVKRLELQDFERQITPWELRYLLPQV